MKTGLKRCVLLAIVFMVLLSGCSPIVEPDDIPEQFTIYATFFPVYALSELVLDGVPGIRLKQLIQPQDGCLRSYTLSDWDAYLMAEADAVIMNGSGLESFSGIYSQFEGEGPAFIDSTSSILPIATAGESEESSHLAGVNPWLFLSVDGAIQMTEAIAANMIMLDPDYEEIYLKNLDSAKKQLQALKDEIEQIMNGADLTVPVALMHEGLIYTAEELGLNVAVRIEHESGAWMDENEMNQALSLIGEANAKVVLIEKQAPDSIIRVLEEAGIQTALLDTLSNGNEALGSEGYFDAMKNNAEAIANALSGR